MNYQKWIRIGYKNGWCGPPVCAIHDDISMSAVEEELLYEGDEPCIHIVRMYPDDITRLNIEDNHAPSVWRAVDQGLT